MEVRVDRQSISRKKHLVFSEHKIHIKYNNNTTHIKSKRIISFPFRYQPTKHLGFDINCHIFLHECNRITLTHSLNLINDRWGCSSTKACSFFVFVCSFASSQTQIHSLYLSFYVITLLRFDFIYSTLFLDTEFFFCISIYKAHNTHITFIIIIFIQRKSMIYIIEGY